MTKEAYLLNLANRYGTDKAAHSYIPAYAKYLPDQIFSLLEVGVDKGASAKMFDDFYDHKPEIHLIDFFGEHGHLTPREARRLGFVPFQGDQSDSNFLRSLPISYDVISEDGSHRSDHQLITFKELFWGKLKEGGVYFMEDTHCCRDYTYWGGLVTRIEDTALFMFKSFLLTGRISNPYFTHLDGQIFEKLIDTVEICADEKLIVIKRK